MFKRQNGRVLQQFAAILLSVGLVVVSTAANLNVAYAEVTAETLEREAAEVLEEETAETPEKEAAKALEEETTETPGEKAAEVPGEETAETPEEESSEVPKEETEQREEGGSEAGVKAGSGKNQEYEASDDSADEDESIEDERFLITGFEDLKVSVYEFEEKPELDTLLKSFPKTLKVTIEKEIDLASDSNASKEKTVNLEVFWTCDEDYEAEDLDEYIFYPVPDLIGCEIAADEVPEIHVILINVDQDTELELEMEAGLQTELEDRLEAVELTATVDGVEVTVLADAGVLPENTVLKVRKVENEKRIEEMRDAIETHMEEQQQGTAVEEMTVYDITLWDEDGNEIQPDTANGEIVVSFRNIEMVENSELENIEIYHFEDESDIRMKKEEAAVEDAAVTCSVEHFSEYAVVKVMAAQTGTAVAQIGAETFTTFEDALANVTDGEMIQLLDNAAVTESVKIDKSITIELDQHELSYNGTSIGFTIQNGVDTVTFQNGTVKGGIKALNGSSLIINNCTIEAEYVHTLEISNGKSIELRASSFINTGSSKTTIYLNGSFDGIDNVTISDCTISSLNASCTEYALKLYGLIADNSVVVSNTHIIAVNERAVDNAFNLEEDVIVSFEEGNIIEGQMSLAGFSEQPLYKISIKGGRFSSDHPFVNSQNDTIELLKRLDLTGGEFKVDVTPFTANGYACVKNESGADGYIYTVVKANGSGPVYVLNDSGKQYYEDLETALDQTAEVGEIIYVESDTEISDLTKLSGRTLSGAGIGNITYDGTLAGFLAGIGDAQLNGINLACEDVKLSSAYVLNAKLTGGAGFTEENYSNFSSLLAEGYLINAYSYEIRPESYYTAKVGCLGGFTLDNAIRAAVKNDSESSQVNDEIILLRDTYSAIHIYDSYATFTIDFNGHTINNEKYERRGIQIEQGADHVNLTLKNGTVSATDFGIVTNGTLTDIILNLEDVNVEADSVGMYLPANGKTTIMGGSISGGKTGIEIRGGTLVMDNVTVSGNGSFSEQANNNGTTTSGVGLAVVQHTTKHPIEVVISGCSISGTENAVRQRDLQGNQLDNVHVTIMSGTYDAYNDAAVFCENVTGFITGGTYSSNPDVNYIADGYESIQNADGTYTVRKAAAAGGIEDGDAAVWVSAEAVPEPQKPEGLSADMEVVFAASVQTAKHSVMSLGANTAVSGNADAISDLAKAVEENGLLNQNVLTKISLEQELADSEFETMVQTDENGEVIGVQVLPKSLTFEVTAFLIHLDEDKNELPDTREQIDLSEVRMTRKVPFTFRFPVPSAVTAAYANVEHEGDPVAQYLIEGSGEAKYVTVSVWHLSQFKLTFTNEPLTNPDDDDTTPDDNTNPGTNTGNGSSDSGSDTASTGGYWILDEKGWWYRRSDGSYPRAQWFACIWNDRIDWYHFDTEGYMDDGWFTDHDGRIYFLHNISDNTRGHMYTGWHLIGGKWYYFNPYSGGPQGSLLTNAITPDGYMVNEKGEWVQ